MSQVICQLAAAAVESPDRIAIKSRDRAVRYIELPFAIAALAARINTFDPSSRPFALCLADGLDWALAHLALRQLGRAAVLLTEQVALDRVVPMLHDVGASCAMTVFGLHRLDDGVDPSWGDSAVFLLRTGTAGSGRKFRFSEEDILDRPRRSCQPGNVRIRSFSDFLFNASPLTSLVTLYEALAHGTTCSIGDFATWDSAQRWADELMRGRLTRT